jgi:hypothetical protein
MKVSFKDWPHEIDDTYKFASYWKAAGGLPRLGLPLGPAAKEVDPETGRTFMMQWFERARLEWHPENQPPHDVLAGLLGKEVLKLRQENALLRETLKLRPRRVMGLHINDAVNPHTQAVALVTKPVLIMVPVWVGTDKRIDQRIIDGIRQIRRHAPDAIIVSSYGMLDDPLGRLKADPEGFGSFMGEQTRELAVALPEVNAWAGLNEVPESQFNNWAIWQERFNRVMRDKPVLAYKFASGGAPTSADAWRPLLRGLTASNVVGIASHEYWFDKQLYDSAWDTWRQFRYRRSRAALIDADRALGEKLEWYLTEVAYTGSVTDGETGWRDRIPAKDYAEQITYYANQVRKDSYVRGAALFCVDAPGSFWDRRFGVLFEQPILEAVRTM